MQFHKKRKGKKSDSLSKQNNTIKIDRVRNPIVLYHSVQRKKRRKAGEGEAEGRREKAGAAERAVVETKEQKRKRKGEGEGGGRDHKTRGKRFNEGKRKWGQSLLLGKLGGCLLEEKKKKLHDTKICKIRTPHTVQHLVTGQLDNPPLTVVLPHLKVLYLPISSFVFFFPLFHPLFSCLITRRYWDRKSILFSTQVFALFMSSKAITSCVNYVFVILC